MEEKNIVNEELMVQDNTDIVEDYELEECSGGGLGKLLIGGLVLGAGAIGAFVYKKVQPKLEERKIEKLKKKGYVIYKAEEVEAIVQVDVDDEVEEETDSVEE